MSVASKHVVIDFSLITNTSIQNIIIHSRKPKLFEGVKQQVQTLCNVCDVFNNVVNDPRNLDQKVMGHQSCHITFVQQRVISDDFDYMSIDAALHKAGLATGTVDSYRDFGLDTINASSETIKEGLSGWSGTAENLLFITSDLERAEIAQYHGYSVLVTPTLNAQAIDHALSFMAHGWTPELYKLGTMMKAMTIVEQSKGTTPPKFTIIGS